MSNNIGVVLNKEVMGINCVKHIIIDVSSLLHVSQLFDFLKYNKHGVKISIDKYFHDLGKIIAENSYRKFQEFQKEHLMECSFFEVDLSIENLLVKAFSSNKLNDSQLLVTSNKSQVAKLSKMSIGINIVILSQKSIKLINSVELQSYCNSNSRYNKNMEFHNSTQRIVYSKNNGSITLKQILNDSGGEGIIYNTEKYGTLCKIYRSNKATSIQYEKIEKLIQTGIYDFSLGLPRDILYADIEHRYPIGYLMNRLPEGKSLGEIYIAHIQNVVDFYSSIGEAVDGIICYDIVKKAYLLYIQEILIMDYTLDNFSIREDNKGLLYYDVDSFYVKSYKNRGMSNDKQKYTYQLDNRIEAIHFFQMQLLMFVFRVLNYSTEPFVEDKKSDKVDFRFREGKYNASETMIRIWNTLPHYMKKLFQKGFSTQESVPIEEILICVDKYNKTRIKNDIFSLDTKKNLPFNNKIFRRMI